MVFPAEVAFSKEEVPLQTVAEVAVKGVGADGKAETINSPEKSLVSADPQPP